MSAVAGPPGCVQILSRLSTNEMARRNYKPGAKHGAIHRNKATAEQRSHFQRMLQSMEFPAEDVAAPEDMATGEAALVSFHVDDVEMEMPLELAETLGLTKTMLARVAWRIGTCLMEAHTKATRHE